MRDSEFCINHDPTRAEENRRRGSKGGKRGGRGRASSEFTRLQHRLEELAQMVLDGEIERGTASVAGQLLGSARACVRDRMAAKEQEELISRLEALEAALEAPGDRSWRSPPRSL
jgi:hypothetical protein